MKRDNLRFLDPFDVIESGAWFPQQIKFFASVRGSAKSRKSRRTGRTPHGHSRDRFLDFLSFLQTFTVST
jgi:hypothetical protein